MPGSARPGSMNLTYSNGHGYEQQELHAEFAHVPVGKQRRHPPRHPSSIWYTSSSGIWQTVWLEPVNLGLCSFNALVYTSLSLSACLRRP